MNFRMRLQSVTVLCLSFPAVGLGATIVKTIMEVGQVPYPANNGDVCVLSGPLPAGTKYEPLAKIIGIRSTYGGTNPLYEPIVREARMIGADAIINLEVGQRIRPFQLRGAVTPAVNGQAVKLLPGSQELDCLQVGGKLWGPSGPIAAQDSDSDLNEDDIYDALLKLDDLRDREILTDGEFQIEKRKLLERN
jgi:hypothetical protein